MLFDRSGKAKRRRELKNELKELQRAFTAAGCGKAEAAGRCKELGETIELGETLCDGYRDARGHLSGARDAIPKLLDCMGESPVDEVEKSLQSLMAHLEQDTSCSYSVLLQTFILKNVLPGLWTDIFSRCHNSILYDTYPCVSSKNSVFSMVFLGFSLKMNLHQCQSFRWCCWTGYPAVFRG